MLIDINISEEQNLINEINAANKTNHTVDTLQFDKPLLIDGVDPGDKNLRNTQIIVKATPQSKYEGSRLIKYRRVSISNQWLILHQKGFELELDEDISDDDDENKNTIINEIKAWFNYKESSIDLKIENDPNDSYIYKVKLSAKPNSLIYIGEINLIVKFKK